MKLQQNKYFNLKLNYSMNMIRIKISKEVFYLNHILEQDQSIRKKVIQIKPLRSSKKLSKCQRPMPNTMTILKSILFNSQPALTKNQEPSINSRKKKNLPSIITKTLFSLEDKSQMNPIFSILNSPSQLQNNIENSQTTEKVSI